MNTIRIIDASTGLYGVVIQTRTGGVVSNLIYGYIPTSLITLYTSVGLDFNKTTGYFEKGVQTDISFSEATETYNTLKESTSNKVTSISASSTDAQYPSAKCMYDIVGDIETLLAAI